MISSKELNEDVLLEIMALVEPRDILNLRQVCRLFYSTSHIRRLWSSLLARFVANGIPPIYCAQHPSPVLPQQAIEQIALRSSFLNRNWKSSSPAVQRSLILQSTTASLTHGPILRLLHDQWLLSALGSRLEFWHLPSGVCSHVCDTLIPIANLSARMIDDSSLIVILQLDCPSTETFTTFLRILHITVEALHVHRTVRVWDQRVPSTEYWGAGQPSIDTNVVAIPLVHRPSMHNEVCTSILLIDWKRNVQRYIMIPDQHDVKCINRQGKLVVAGKNEDLSISIALYDIEDLQTIAENEQLPARCCLNLSPSLAGSFRITLSEPTFEDADLSIVVLVTPLEVSDRHIIRYRIVARVSDNDATSYELNSMEEHSVEIMPSNRYSTPNVNCHIDGTGKRALLVQKIKTGPGACTMDTFDSCTFMSDGSSIIRSIKLPLLHKSMLQNTTSEAFDECCGVVAWTQRGIDHINVVNFAR